MGKYLASQIIAGNLKYGKVVKKYPQYQESILSYIASKGYMINEDGECVLRGE